MSTPGSLGVPALLEQLRENSLHAQMLGLGWARDFAAQSSSLRAARSASVLLSHPLGLPLPDASSPGTVEANDLI